MELRIREFQKQDMDALYFLDQGCYPAEQRSPYNTLLETLLDKDCAALVAEEIGEGYAKVIGALIVQGDPHNSKLYVTSLMVNEEFRRLGIARRLLGWAERLARGFKCDALLVRLPQDDAPGEAFLCANGFTVSEQAEQDPDGEANTEEQTAQDPDGEANTEEQTAQDPNSGPEADQEVAQIPDSGPEAEEEGAQIPDGEANAEEEAAQESDGMAGVEEEVAQNPDGEANTDQERAPNLPGGQGVLWIREVGDEAAT